MNYLLRSALIPLLVCCLIHGHGQETAAIDSIKNGLARSTSPEDKVYYLDNLSRTFMNVNLEQAEQYGKQLIVVAEESRNRKLMVDAYVSNGLRCSYFSGQKNYTERSIDFYNKGLAIARKDKMEEAIGGIQLRLAAVHLAIPDKDKALSYVNQGFSIISTLPNDSLKAEAHNSYGHVYLSRNEKTLALRHYLNALRIAEELKAEPSRNDLLRNCYQHLSRFYAQIEDYDKAIDYATLAYKQLDHSRQKNAPFQRAIDLNGIGNLFAMKKNYDIAISYFERSIALADSLKFSTLKIPGYISLLNQYLRMDQPNEALAYMNSASGLALKKHLVNFGFSGIIDQAYGVIYTETNQFDSARHYFNLALPYFEKSTSEANRVYFYRQLAGMHKKTGEHKKAIEYYLKVKDMGERMGQLEHVEAAAKQLDTLYGKTGDYLQANLYSGIYHQYKDSIQKLNKEKELTQVEAADEQQRQLRLAKEKEERDRRRNNIQYLGITIGIAALFIALVLLGMFKVSATTIKMIGFFAFLMFFEFIFLLFKKNIYALTRGEPWKDLLFMIGLAALLLPLHHWLEEKVIHYLTSHNRLTAAGHHLRRRLFRKVKAGED
ncbi:MAG TPA: hypothetical protein VFX58_19640 [Chitinophagaceae bacterium]|nr:hypothetical protein [Chitinophagaceae bacterium]